MNSAILSFSRLSLSAGAQQARSFTTRTAPLLFRATDSLLSEPMKRKKKLDVNVQIQKETKRKRKLEKAIRRIEMKGRKLKPVEEIEGDRKLMKTLHERRRAPVVLSFEEGESRALLLKEWQRFRRRQALSGLRQLTVALAEQDKALAALREESEELYQAAVQPAALPAAWCGPTSTPPHPAYACPDGEYVNTTKTYDEQPLGNIRIDKL